MALIPLPRGMMKGYTGGQMRPQGQMGGLTGVSRLFRVKFWAMAGGLALAATACVFATDPEPELVFVDIPSPTATATRVPSPPPVGQTAPLINIPVAATAQASTEDASPTATATTEPTATATAITPTPTSTPLPTNTVTASPTRTRVSSQQSQPAPTATAVPSPTLTPTATRTPDSPNDAPTVEVLEFDGRSVSSPADLQRRATPREEIGIRVRAKDTDGNLAFVAIIESGGREIERKRCNESRGKQCTVIFSVKASSRVGEFKTFFAVAEDSRGRQSNIVQMSIETIRAPIGGGGGGGGGGSTANTPVPPTPTCTAIVDPLPTFSAPTLALESGNGCVGQTIMLNIVLSDAPNGFSGFHAIVAVANPSIAEIVDVQYNSLLSPTEPPAVLPSSEAVLFAADVNTA
ncbi:MAG: hypothetical protein IIC85_15305, partial [Chloroflexi bacterium]|nr:hypothetical protein [Chloroflexota bacterium]